MKILNVYSSKTGNTAKVAAAISEAVAEMSHEVDTVRLDGETVAVDILGYDVIFAGSGVFGCMPSKTMLDFLTRMGEQGTKGGDIQPCSPRLLSKYAVIYCTYGGVHTGINEAVPCIKNIGQLFDHHGFEILDEWYFVGAYNPSNMQELNLNGRLGDIRGRPNDQDLQIVSEKTRGVLMSLQKVSV